MCGGTMQCRGSRCPSVHMGLPPHGRRRRSYTGAPGFATVYRRRVAAGVSVDNRRPPPHLGRRRAPARRRPEICMAVVVVESPAKAKTINKYLGPGYTVLASYGHVRDLPPKDGSVDPEHDFAMTLGGRRRRVEARPRHRRGAEGRPQAHPRHRPRPRGRGDLLAPARGADRPQGGEEGHRGRARRLQRHHQVRGDPGDGEARARSTWSWSTPTSRAGRSTTSSASSLSPVLWRKLPGAKSAGRVQSVALRLIVDREMEIEAFRAREYWTVKADPRHPARRHLRGAPRLLDGRKLDKFDLANEAAATPRRRRDRGPRPRRRGRRVEARDPEPGAAVHDLDAAAGGEPQVRHGRAPDDERRAAALRGRPHHLHAHRRHRHGAGGGDGRPRRDPGPLRRAYVPSSPRMYKNKAKNAQEAHECIRPTDMGRAPEALRARARPAQALRPDLEALDRQPDGGRALRAHHRRRRLERRALSACAPPARS